VALRILSKFLVAEFCRFFAYVIVMVVCIYLIVDFIERIDDLLDAGLPFYDIASYFIFKTPLIVSQIAPVGSLLAVLIVIGLMNRRNELIALKAGGISASHILKPMSLLGVVIAIGLFFWAEVLVPISVSKSNRLWQEKVDEESIVSIRQKNIWIKGTRSIYHFKFFNPKTKQLHGISLNYFDDEFNLVRRVDAGQAHFKSNEWLLKDVMVQQWEYNPPDYRVTVNDLQSFDMDLHPDDFQQVIKKAEEMSFYELIDYINQVEHEGYDATHYRVDLYAKTAYPAIVMILVVLGTGIAVRRRSQENLAVSIAIGLSTVFIYWTFYNFCLSLGYGTVLPPLLAAWIANLIALCGAALLLLNAD
jgi:lipopolysaccharide export system permease protein